MNDKLKKIQIPEGWEKKLFVKFSSRMQSGGTPKSDNPNFYNGNIPFVAIDDLTSTNKYLYKTKKKITNQGLANSSAWTVPVNSLMYSIYATLGVPRINKIVAATNQAILNIIPDENIIDLEFLYYLLLEKRTTILAHSAHTTQSNLNAKIVKELEFTLPTSLTEQKKIAQILSTVDKAIEQTGQLIAKYQCIKTGLMQDLLTKGIDENGNIRSEETHEFKDSELGRIPKEWEVEKLENLYKNPIRDFGSFSSTNLITFLEEGVPFIKSEMIEEDNINWSSVMYISKNVHKLLTKSYVLKGNILFSKIGSALGKAVIYNENYELCNSNAAVAKIEIDTSTVNANYITNYLNSFMAKKQFAYMIVSLLPRINLGDINQLLIPRMSIEEQDKGVAMTNIIKKFIDETNIELSKLQSIKTGLMQDLLSGKKRVNSIINGEL